MTEEDKVKQNVDYGNDEKSETEYLKDCVIRLTKELLSYQGSTPEETHLERYHGIELPRWMMDSEVISPLFLAYDRRIDELSGMIEQQGSYMDKLTASVSNLSQENLALRERLQMRISPIDTSLPNTAQVEDKAMEKGHTEDDVEMRRLRSDNALLEEQTDLLVQELEGANRSISSRDKTIADLTHEVKNKLDFVETLQSKKIQLEREKNVSEQKLMDSIKDLESHRQRSRDLTDKVKSLKALHTDMSSKVNVASSDMLDLEKRNDELQREIIEISVFTQELENKLASANTEYERLSEEHLQQTKDLVSTKTESERMARSLSKLKSKFLQKSNISHEDETCNIRDIKMKLSEVELSRDILEAKVKSIQGEMDRIMGSKASRGEMKRYQADIEKVKSQHGAEMEAQEKTMSSYKQTICDLEFRLEHQERKMKEVFVRNKTLEDCLNSERSAKSSGVEKLNKALNCANDALNNERRKYNEAEKNITRLQTTIEKLKESLEILTNDLHVLQKEDKLKTRQWRDTQAAHRHDTKELELKLQSITVEKEDVERTYKAAIIEATRQRDSTVSELKLKIEEQEKSLQLTSTTVQECKDSFDKITNEYKLDQSKVNKCLEECTEQFRQCHEDQLTKIKELGLKCTSLNEDRARLDLCLKEKERSINALNNDLGDAEVKIASLGRQLSHNLKEQKMRIERERELKLENHKLKLREPLNTIDANQNMRR